MIESAPSTVNECKLLQLPDEILVNILAHLCPFRHYNPSSDIKLARKQFLAYSTVCRLFKGLVWAVYVRELWLDPHNVVDMFTFFRSNAHLSRQVKHLNYVEADTTSVRTSVVYGARETLPDAVGLLTSLAHFELVCHDSIRQYSGRNPLARVGGDLKFVRCCGLPHQVVQDVLNLLPANVSGLSVSNTVMVNKFVAPASSRLSDLTISAVYQHFPYTGTQMLEGFTHVRSLTLEDAFEVCDVAILADIGQQLLSLIHIPPANTYVTVAADFPIPQISALHNLKVATLCLWHPHFLRQLPGSLQHLTIRFAYLAELDTDATLSPLYDANWLPRLHYFSASFECRSYLSEESQEPELDDGDLLYLEMLHELCEEANVALDERDILGSWKYE